jgi:hypothetical protein
MRNMKNKLKTVLVGILLGISFASFSQQIEEIKLNPEKVKMFLPYMEYKHGGAQGFPAWKNSNKMQYAKEMWYYTESFYVKRNVLSEGLTLNEEIVDVSRFEDQRKQDEEVTITLGGFKDVVVLLPASKLIYKPN